MSPAASGTDPAGRSRGKPGGRSNRAELAIPRVTESRDDVRIAIQRSSIAAVTTRTGRPLDSSSSEPFRSSQHANDEDFRSPAIARAVARSAAATRRSRSSGPAPGPAAPRGPPAATPDTPGARTSPRRGPGRRTPSEPRAAALQRPPPFPSRPAARARAAAAGEHGPFRRGERGLNVHAGAREIAGRLVDEHRRQIPQRGAKGRPVVRSSRSRLSRTATSG